MDFDQAQFCSWNEILDFFDGHHCSFISWDQKTTIFLADITIFRGWYPSLWYQVPSLFSGPRSFPGGGTPGVSQPPFPKLELVSPWGIAVVKCYLCAKVQATLGTDHLIYFAISDVSSAVVFEYKINDFCSIWSYIISISQFHHQGRNHRGLIEKLNINKLHQTSYQRRVNIMYKKTVLDANKLLDTWAKECECEKFLELNSMLNYVPALLMKPKMAARSY